MDSEYNDYINKECEKMERDSDKKKILKYGEFVGKETFKFVLLFKFLEEKVSKDMADKTLIATIAGVLIERKGSFDEIYDTLNKIKKVVINSERRFVKDE